MSEGERSRKVRKTGSPGRRVKNKEPGGKKPEVGGLKSEDSKPETAINAPQSEIKEKLATDHSPLTTKMEVHHHPEVEKKGFKEYLLEGLMIFLAVTMGFFAESLRETINEHNRAKEFAVTLYADLKADTAELNDYVDYFGHAAKNVDTLMKLLSAAEPEQISSGKLYWYGLGGGAHRVFIEHDATLLEMKSSGSLIYFGNKAINRKLAQYDQLYQVIRVNDANDAPIYTEVRKIRAQIFEFPYNDAANNIWRSTMIWRKNNIPLRTRLVDSFVKTNPPLLTHDKVLFNQYVEMVRSRFLKDKVQKADTLLYRANELIGLLKKKYELEDEE